jgi:hypothetical protein
MHVAAQKDLERTTIYSADAHEMSFRQVVAPRPQSVEALLQPIQTKALTLIGKPPRRKIGSRQCGQAAAA